MKHTFDSNQPVGEIVAAFPGASNLFKANKIDFCCGGGKSLSTALRQRSVPEEPFLQALRLAYDETQQRQDSAGMDWREVSTNALIKQIVTVHHAYLWQELPLLAGFTIKIARVHGERHPELMALNVIFHRLMTRLEPQLRAEETELFPRLLAYEQSGVQDDLTTWLGGLNDVTAGHEETIKLLDAMSEVTHGFELPADACRTYTIAFQKLKDLESDLLVHIHLENNILFPRMQRSAESPA